MNGVCAKTYTHVPQTSEDLHPYMCNVSECLGTNYCIPKRWPMGPFQQSFPPWLKPLVTPLLAVTMYMHIKISITAQRSTKHYANIPEMINTL